MNKQDFYMLIIIKLAKDEMLIDNHKMRLNEPKVIMVFIVQIIALKEFIRGYSTKD